MPGPGDCTRGRVDLGAWPGRLYERESRLGHLALGTQFERDSTVGTPGPEDCMRGSVD